MSIKKYTNFEKINQKTDNEGKFIQEKDLFIVSKSEIEDSDFGDCKYDVLEVSVYDINNNLLPHKSGDTVAYIKSGGIKEYMYNITNTRGKKEIAIDVEKLLDDLGFSNGILRVNFNFIRNRVGDESQLRKVWIQEISATRNEIRIVPLKTTNQFINEQNKKDLDNLSNLNKDFKYYRKSILDSLYSFEGVFMDKIKSYLEAQYGKDYFTLIRKDFGLRDFDKLATKIYEDYRESVTYYLTNRAYDISKPAWGLQSGIRFEDCDQYDFDMMVKEMENILRTCISHNTGFLKRRDFNVVDTPQEFKAVEPAIEIQNNLDSFQTPEVRVATTYPTILPAPTPMPPQVVVPQAKGFYYTLKNKKSNGSLIFVFNNVTGQKVQKTLSPGQSFTVCAQDGTVSTSVGLSTRIGRFGIDDILSADSSKSGLRFVKEWDIIKGKECSTVDMTDKGPKPSIDLIEGQFAVPSRFIKPQVELQTGRGGGITRSEAAAVTNQIRVSGGRIAISTAEASGMSEGVRSLQPTTMTGVRQTSLSGPIID